MPKNIHITPSKFAMWRTAISLAHADGHLSNSEVAIIHEFWERFDFTPEQTRQLEDDFRDGVKFDEVYPGITDKLDRAHLIYFAMILFHVDDDFSALEKKMWETLNDRHMATVDYKQALKDAKAAGQDYILQDQLKRARELESTKNPFMKATYYLINASEDREDFEKVVW